MTWMKLGLLEWTRSISCRSKDRTGRLDFLFLTILLALTLNLGMLLLGTREGILDRFIDSSLGRVQGYGIPIWVYTKIVDRSGQLTSLIDAKYMDRLKHMESALESEIYVYREVEANRVSLPGYDQLSAFEEDASPAVWRDEQGLRPISIRAVASADPLWRKAGVPERFAGGLPLAIVLNRSLFERHFDCKVYVEAVMHSAHASPLLPSALQSLQDAAGAGSGLSCLDTGKLYLLVKSSPKHLELVPFDIIWRSPRIETMEEVAALFPLDTFNAIALSMRLPAMRYYPEGAGAAVRRVSKVRVWSGSSAEATDGHVAKLLECFGRRARRDGTGFVKMNPAVRETHLLECAEQAGIPVKPDGLARCSSRPCLTIARSQSSHALTPSGDHGVETSCSALGKYADRFGCTRTPEGEWQPDRVRASLVALLGGYQFAQIYVRNRSDVLNAVTRMRTETGGLLTLRPEYENALKRFMFINDVVSLLRSAVLPVFGLFLLILLVVQLGMVVTHRRHNYGVLLAVGLRPISVVAMVSLQIAASFATAFLLAVTAFEVVRHLLKAEMVSLLEAGGYKRFLDIGDPDLLPLTYVDLSLVGLLAGLITIVVTIAILTKLLAPWPFGRIPEPASLLYS